MNSVAPTSTVARILLAGTLFLLSADLLYVDVGGNKIKYGYFLVVLLWALGPARMLDAAAIAVRRVPRIALLVLIPLIVSGVTSVDVRASTLWALWLIFDLFAVLTVYSFLKAQGLSPDDVEGSVIGALGLIAAFGIAQYIAIFGFDRVLFSPQLHAGTYRLNGLSGWPHFLNIFAFLLLPMVVQRVTMTPVARIVLVAIVFLLVQSTAKTGWVLAAMLGLLLAVANRRSFTSNFVFFLLPVAFVAALVPTPSIVHRGEALSGTEKLTRIAGDLDVRNATTSGNDRMLINTMGVQVWLRHPWFGVGPKAYNTYVWTRFDREMPGVNKLDATHNINAKNENVWIEMLAECGGLFTLGFALVVGRVLWPRPGLRDNPLELGAWMALVLYFVVSTQVSQNGLLTLVYAVFGICLYAREIGATVDGGAGPEADPRSKMTLQSG